MEAIDATDTDTTIHVGPIHVRIVKWVGHDRARYRAAQQGIRAVHREGPVQASLLRERRGSIVDGTPCWR